MFQLISLLDTFHLSFTQIYSTMYLTPLLRHLRGPKTQHTSNSWSSFWNLVSFHCSLFSMKDNTIFLQVFQLIPTFISLGITFTFWVSLKCYFFHLSMLQLSMSFTFSDLLVPFQSLQLDTFFLKHEFDHIVSHCSTLKPFSDLSCQRNVMPATYISLCFPVTVLKK